VSKATVHSTSNLSIFDNLSIGEIVDRLGHAKAEAAEIKVREDALKAALIARGFTEAEGMLFRATVSEALRETLDADKIKTEMGPSWCSIHSKIGVVTIVRVNARKGVALSVAA
jgi:hypothetical protein